MIPWQVLSYGDAEKGVVVIDSPPYVMGLTLISPVPMTHTFFPAGSLSSLHTTLPRTSLQASMRGTPWRKDIGGLKGGEVESLRHT